ncbi:MAG: hypothetical protein C1943_01825 [Halochromatium sp.]|nr:hypothetical protein [Halochromatium sp.]
MRVFVDCDVLLDVALDRKPFVAASGKLLDHLETGQDSAAMAWHSSSATWSCKNMTNFAFESRSSHAEAYPLQEAAQQLGNLLI